MVDGSDTERVVKKHGQIACQCRRVLDPNAQLFHERERAKIHKVRRSEEKVRPVDNKKFGMLNAIAIPC
jgi:hypothetical protein